MALASAARGVATPLSPKIEQFLNENAPPTPCLVMDLDQVERNYLAMQAAFPAARIFYALKANPARPVLHRLAQLGAGFDAASWSTRARARCCPTR